MAADAEEESEPALTAVSPPANQSVGSLVSGITADFSTLFRKELELAKEEVSEILRSKLRAVAVGVAGLVLVALLMPMLLFTLVEVLAVWLPRWAASGIVTLVVILFAAVAFLLAKRWFGSKFLPEKTIQSIKEDVQWAKDLKKH